MLKDDNKHILVEIPNGEQLRTKGSKPMDALDLDNATKTYIST